MVIIYGINSEKNLLIHKILNKQMKTNTKSAIVKSANMAALVGACVGSIFTTFAFTLIFFRICVLSNNFLIDLFHKSLYGKPFLEYMLCLIGTSFVCLLASAILLTIPKAISRLMSKLAPMFSSKVFLISICSPYILVGLTLLLGMGILVSKFNYFGSFQLSPIILISILLSISIQILVVFILVPLKALGVLKIPFKLPFEW